MCALKEGSSTDETELMALDTGAEYIENVLKMENKLLKYDLPVMAYKDCDTLQNNLMNKTVPAITRIRYRCKKTIYEE